MAAPRPSTPSNCFKSWCTLEAFLELELEEHLGYAARRGGPWQRQLPQRRHTQDGTGDFGEIGIETPRDRNSSFEPKIVAKRQTSVGNFGEAVVSLYARGMTTREIEQHVKEIYGVEISPQFVSRVTEELQQQIAEWQSRPLERVYLVFVDGLRVAVRTDKGVLKKCVYTVLGVSLSGKQEVATSRPAKRRKFGVLSPLSHSFLARTTPIANLNSHLRQWSGLSTPADHPLAATAPTASSRRPAKTLFGLTIFLSACLLFLVQPLIAKLILPWFGGSAAVWITCLLFFQGGLLLGYVYAHVLARALQPRTQTLLHTALLALGFAALPILPNPVWQPRPGADPTWPLFAALATSVGLPYLLLASTSPLLQSWYAFTHQRLVPYRYFALSNAGSLLALLSYPILLEPRLTAHQQSWAWSIGFVLFAALCIATAFLPKRPPLAEPSEPPTPTARPPLSKSEIALWLALSACASTLLLAVTNLLTQNIAPMPLLWVLPLSAYLLTFILCFESTRWYKRFLFLPLIFPALACLAAAIKPLENRSITLAVPVFTGALFVCSMACHGELARLKPHPLNLTAFYLFVAAGGALGGLFVALLAPHFFPALYEFPIALILCPAALLAALWREHARWKKPDLGRALWLAAVAATIVLAAYTGRETWRNLRNSRLLVRNFYGALRVDDLTDYHRKIRELNHGTIIHGVQFLHPLFRHEPTTYYAWSSGIGLAWRTLADTGPLRMGVVGLGSGTLAAYGRSGDTIRFYDINPAVIRIARTQFTYLADCPAHIDIVLGDARLSMAGEPSQRYDLLVIDAFSGDSIPVHLLTRQAFQIYWCHLKPDGVLAVHISNHYLDLAPVVQLAADESHKQAWQVDSDADDPAQIYTASYVLVSSRPGFFDHLLFRGSLTSIQVPPHLRPWTDDYSNLWQALKFK